MKLAKELLFSILYAS